MPTEMPTIYTLDQDDVVKTEFWTSGNRASLPVFVSGFDEATPLKGVVPTPPSSDTEHVLSTEGWRTPSQASFLLGIAAFVTVTTDDTTMVAGRAYALDTTAGPLTINPNSDPTVGDTIVLFDPQGTWGTNNGTLTGGGRMIEGTEETLVLDVANDRLILKFVGGDKGWRIC